MRLESYDYYAKDLIQTFKMQRERVAFTGRVPQMKRSSPNATPPAAHGSIGIVRLLLEEGANPNIMDKRNASPLHIAADAGQVEVMRMLLNGGAQVNCRDRGGSTPLHWCVQRAPY